MFHLRTAYILDVHTFRPAPISYRTLRIIDILATPFNGEHGLSHHHLVVEPSSIHNYLDIDGGRKTSTLIAKACYRCQLRHTSSRELYAWTETDSISLDCLAYLIDSSTAQNLDWKLCL